EGDAPVDIAVSAEVSSERDRGGSFETALEPRLILSKDFGLGNATLNLAGDIPLDSGPAGFAPALGLRYGSEGLLRVGCEVKYNTASSQGAVIPQVWFDFPHEVTFKTGFSRGFGQDRQDFARFVLELEF